MFRKITDFREAHRTQVDNTTRVLEALTDANLNQKVAEGYRTLGQIAWHIVTSVPEMMNRVGLGLASVNEESPPPAKAAEFVTAYKEVSTEFGNALAAKWDDETLLQTDDIYGQRWPRGVTLAVLLNHEMHHRGQMTVLLRQAGAKVPGVCGPAKEEWAEFGMEAPA
jgi:uncharacterized damage-inducible protein DinB